MKLKNSLKQILKKIIDIEDGFVNARKQVMLLTIGKNICLILHITKKAIKGLIKKFVKLSARYKNTIFLNIQANKLYLTLEVEENNIIKQILFIRNFKNVLRTKN